MRTGAQSFDCIGVTRLRRHGIHVGYQTLDPTLLSAFHWQDLSATRSVTDDVARENLSERGYRVAPAATG